MGDSCNHKKEFYIKGESVNEIGVTDKIFLSALNEKKASFTNSNSIKLAIVTAINSDEMGTFLVKLGIKAVICINAEFKLKDDFVDIFVKKLYDMLFDGNTIQMAFDEALNLCRDELVKPKVCCCAHKHSDECKWYQYALVYGFH